MNNNPEITVKQAKGLDLKNLRFIFSQVKCPFTKNAKTFPPTKHYKQKI